MASHIERARQQGEFNVDAAERALKMPRHGLDPKSDGGPTDALTMAVTRFRREDIDHSDWSVISACSHLGVLDGYALAAKVLGRAKVKKTFKGSGALARFAVTIARAGPALMAGPHAEAARFLVKEAAKRVRRALKPLARDIVENALAAGALLYATERALDFPGLTAKKPVRLEKQLTPIEDAEAPAELVAAIFAAPFDAQPRLVLADWYSERNDPRGLLIQLQCGPESDGRDERARVLINKYQKQWVAPIRPLIRQWQFKRGFVNSVIADFSKFIDGQAALSKVPLLHAKLSGYRPEQLEKADAAPHPSIASIDLGNNRLGLKKNIELISRPFFANITSLDLAGNTFDPRGIERMMAALPAGVTRLQLSSTGFTSEQMRVLSASKHFAKLTHLDLRWNRHLDEPVLDFLEGAPNLEYFGFTIHDFTKKGIEKLASLKLPKLARIAFDGEDVGGLLAFLDAPNMPALTTLDLPYDVPRKANDALEARFKPMPWPSLFEY